MLSKGKTWYRATTHVDADPEPVTVVKETPKHITIREASTLTKGGVVHCRGAKVSSWQAYFPTREEAVRWDCQLGN